ncbi:MAG: DUF1146 domain-containing protein [Akkermansiaceae bacterium]|nr:DUF1146 domain-containing protein [Akkermansiaceae bacterium]
MKIPKFPPQINRLLLLIFAIVISYLVARTILTPASFREHGFYRGDALIERADLDTTLAGKVACGERFPEALAALEKGGHKTLSCEGCHGPMNLKALAAQDAKPPKPPEGFCLRCHEANATRPEAFKQIVVKDHYEGKCLECHLPHEPAEMPPDPDDPPAAPAPDATPDTQPTEAPQP